MSRRTPLVYGILATAWLAILIWQVAEHTRVLRTARASLINHAKDVSTTLGLVMRSERRFGVISQERMESALRSLVKPGELEAIALLNNAGEVVASAGPTINYELKGLAPRGEHWDRHSVTLVNLVDLGTSVTNAPGEGPRPTLVLPRDEMPGPFGTNRGGPPPGPPPPPPATGPTNTAELAPPAPGAGPPEGGPPRGRGRDRRPPFGRPFWMSEEEYQAAIQKQGVHGSVVVLSTRPVLAVSTQDFWLRGFVGLLATVTVAGLALAWRTLLRSADLEVRLARAAELNARLRDMNLAATGLAQETREPLALIRDLAQRTAQDRGAPDAIQRHSSGIISETERVAAQLNDFINYSRPREVRRAPVALGAVVSELVAALGPELQAKTVRLEAASTLPKIEADEALLRQALFNLLANAIRAMDHEGEIRVSAIGPDAGLVTLEIRDDGPDILPEHRADIFKPYFTSNQRGRGLGLAVAHQIVQAHGWEIECHEHTPRGALFRIRHIRAATPA